MRVRLFFPLKDIDKTAHYKPPKKVELISEWLKAARKVFPDIPTKEPFESTAGEQYVVFQFEEPLATVVIYRKER